MKLSQSIEENREEIDDAIHSVVPGYRLNDVDRVMWIMNDEGLYTWAIASGVEDL